jgi:acyl dehydratase
MSFLLRAGEVAPHGEPRGLSNEAAGQNQPEMAITTDKPEEVDMTITQVRSEAATKTPSGRLYLDDLHVGQRFISKTHTLDAAQIKKFAVQFDPQPFHTDEQAAERTFFKERAASGWHTAAITMRLNVESGPPLAGGIVGAGGELSWPAPTVPAMCSMLRARSLKFHRRARDLIAAQSSFSAER